MFEKQKILIVDDQPANLYSLEQILKETGVEVIRAQSGNEALIASLNHNFAIALLDVQMPEMDGYELAELLRIDEKTRELPIIFMSVVYSSDYHVFKGYDAGAVDFLIKPFEPKILLSKVNVFLKLNQQAKLLEESAQNLVEANETLERRVLEKTAYLHETVDKLKAEVAKRAEAERKILKAQEEWQEIFEAIGHMALILDKNHRIVAANRAALEMVGMTHAEIVGQHCYAVFHNPDHPIEQCPMATMLKSENYLTTEAEVEALGRSFIVSCTPVFDKTGELEKIIHIATDITARKKLQKELIQAHKMEAIGSLAGGIAHDFNNILSAVIGFTDLSLQNVEEDHPVAEDLRQVYAAGIRARDLVQQILNFARQTDEVLKPVRIDIVAKEVVKFLRSTIPASVEIKENIASKSLVLSNPVKIHQLLMNLCTNASYAMDEKGVLKIALYDVMCEIADLPQDREMSPGLYQCLQIADDGCGIPPEIIDSIFVPFFTTKGIHEGTGMGLATVYNIVKECGGSISVASEVGRGTMFTILLPVTTQDENPDLLERKENAPKGKERILLVDDEAPICKLASRMLLDYGYTVTTETDSSKAVALFTADPDRFDLVITDMTMPQITGVQLVEKVLAVRPDIPVIIVTGYSKQISDTQAVAIGARALLAKPFEKVGLLKIVRKVLDEDSRVIQ